MVQGRGERTGHSRLFLKSPKNVSPRKAICETANSLFWKPIFYHVFKVTKKQRAVKFEDLNPLRSWDTKGIVTPVDGP